MKEAKVVCRNPNVWKYEIVEEYVAGISLKGEEVKSIREGNVSISEAVIKFLDGSPFIINMYVAPYRKGFEKLDPVRPRHLLLRKEEIKRIYGKTTLRGMEVIPIKITAGKWIKVSIALVRRKKIWDRREEIKKRDEERRERREKF